MFVKLFGLLDILAALILVIQNYFSELFPISIIWAIGIYLLIKGILFAVLLDFASFVDILCSLLIIVGIFIALPKLILAFVIIWLLQKGVFSLLK